METWQDPNRLQHFIVAFGIGYIVRQVALMIVFRQAHIEDFDLCRQQEVIDGNPANHSLLTL